MGAPNRIPMHWEMMKLGQLVSVLGDGLHGTPKYSDIGEYYFINGNNLCQGEIIIKNNTKRVTKEEYEKYKKPLNETTILVSINGTLGNIAFYKNEKVILGKSVCYFNVLDFIDKNYLKTFLSGHIFLNYANNSATGSTIKNVSLKSMRDFDIPVPPLLEQEAIVSKIEELLSDVENGKQQLLTAREQLKVYRQSLLKWAFEGKLTEEWRKQNPQVRIQSGSEENETTLEMHGSRVLIPTVLESGEVESGFEPQLVAGGKTAKSKAKKVADKNAVKQIKEVPEARFELGELPEGWTWVRISELCNVVRGGSPRPAGDPKYYDGNIPFLKVRDITKDERIYLSTFEYTIKEAGLHKTRQIKPNTLLLSNSGATLGVPKICMIDATMNDGIAAFLDLDVRSNLYLYYFWVSKTKELRSINMGAAQPNLNTDIIKNYMVPYCSFQEQQVIVEELESKLTVCDKIEEAIESSLQQAETLKQSILKMAFEGRLV